jgi:ribokinase
MRIFGFGALNLDLIYEVDDLRSISARRGRLEPGEELFGSDDEFDALLEQLRRVAVLKSRSGGGSAANSLVALGRMGFPTAFIGKVGEDAEGDFLLGELRPVRTDLIRRQGRSGICLVVLDRHHDRFLFVKGNTNNTLTQDDIEWDFLQDISWVHLTSFISERPLEAQKFFLSRLDATVKVSLDPGEIYAKKGLKEMTPLIRRSHVLFVTEKEIEILTGQDLTLGTQMLLDMGPSALVCKRGSRGSRVFSRQGDFEAPATLVEVVDNTGAGDVYNAGFLAGVLLDKSLQESARFATQVASKSVTGYGRSCYPTAEDLRRFFG